MKWRWSAGKAIEADTMTAAARIAAVRLCKRRDCQGRGQVARATLQSHP